jgi:hypothetical protein
VETASQNVKVKKSWVPLLSGLLLAGASIPYVMASLRFYVAPEYLPDFQGGTRIWGPVGFLVWAPFLIPLIAGALAGLARRGWGLVVACALLPILLSVVLEPWMETGIGRALFFFLPVSYRGSQVIEFSAYLCMLAAAVLAVVYRDAFGGMASVGERLYGPPRWYRRDRS